MKTITFYSYKGGVGRTLALVNIANRLAEFGKKVCVMDFDLEAPGLIHKYKYNISEVKQGLVDYIYEFAVEENLPDSIGKYAKEIKKYKYSDEKDLEKDKTILFLFRQAIQTAANIGENFRISVGGTCFTRKTAKAFLSF